MKKQRIVVKVGTSLLTKESGELELEFIHSLVQELCYLVQSDSQVILVTSGAIGIGMKRLGLRIRPRDIPLKQACAAVGQSLLMETYEQLFGRYNQTIAQVLLTHSEFSNRKSYLNISRALFTLFDYGVIPIINENDTVAVEEIKVGDNDTLSALVSSLIEADWLIILTNIYGLYDEQQQVLSIVEEITPKIIGLAKGTNNQVCTGGMTTKLEAAKIAMNSGVTMVIANGKEREVIRRIINLEGLGTTFIAQKDVLTARKRWLYNLKTHGEIEIDAGAENAIIHSGKSLLPSGIIRVKGWFNEGSAISIVNAFGKKLANGLTNYSKKDIERIKGKNSNKIEEILGYKYNDEIVHRDNMVIFTNQVTKIH